MTHDRSPYLIALILTTVITLGCQKNPPATSPAETTTDAAAPASTDNDTAASDESETGVPATTGTEATTTTQTQAVEEVVAVPIGLPALPIPEDNPLTAAKIELGKLLYFDTRLSKDGRLSCATCHDPQMAWAEHTPTSSGIGGQLGGRNSPSIINAAYAPAQFWDGRAATLEEQSLGPMENPIEMGHNLPDIVNELNQIEAYRQRFQEVFGTGVTTDGMAKAIAAFERTVLSGNSPYDKFQAGEKDALTQNQQEGMELFESAGCSTCHTPPLFSNYRYYNAGVGADQESPDEGRKAVTGRDSDAGKFRVPALRDVANTAPYFHDGGAATLEDAVNLMADGGKDNPNLSVMLKAVRDESLSETDRQKIVEFLQALSGEYPIVEPPDLP